MFTRSVLPILVIAFTSQAYAETYYDTLKTYFAAAKSSPIEEDFDRVGRPQSKICIEVKAALPDNERMVRIARFVEIKKGRGPSLPDKRYVTVLFSEYGAPDIGATAGVKTTFGNRETISVLANEEFYKHTLKVRKDVTNAGDILVFERTEVNTYIVGEGKKAKRETKTNIHYGYCYPRSAEAIAADAAITQYY
jgi:hypothetical protein